MGATSAKQHPYHILNLSPWPICTTFSLLILAIGGIMLMHHYNHAAIVALFGLICVLSSMFCWWKDVIKESFVEKHHTKEVRQGLQIGMLLFILSEVMFFAVFFWSYFKARIFPVDILDGIWSVGPGVWPPKGIETFDPWDIPFLNTLILLLSGTTVTWAHYALKNNNQKETVKALGITIILGLIFTSLQAYEYHHASFKLTDGIYAANFYLATGFHGIHVIIGTIFLTVCYFRARNGEFVRPNSHLGFEFAAWYWHFVDVVWIFLFIFVYVLGR